LVIANMSKLSITQQQMHHQQEYDMPLAENRGHIQMSETAPLAMLQGEMFKEPLEGDQAGK